MKNDKKIERKVAEIQSLCSSFLSYVKNLNPNNESDNILVNIIKKNEELKELFCGQDKETEGNFKKYLDKELGKTNILSEEVKEMIKECVEEERECGVIICDFDDHQHDLREIAEVVGIQMIFKADKQEWGFANSKDKKLVEAALNYYYELHS